MQLTTRSGSEQHGPKVYRSAPPKSQAGDWYIYISIYSISFYILHCVYIIYICVCVCLSTTYTSAVGGVYACVSKFDQEHACIYLNVRLCAHDCCWCEASYRSYRQESN